MSGDYAKTRPLLSFVMLTWNSEKTIIRAMDSILETMKMNDLEAFEVFVVDNGSTDSTRELLDRYRNRKNIEVIELGKNHGTTCSRNIALRKARGKYICVIDSDVVIKKWATAESLTFIDAHKCLVGAKLAYPNGSIQPSAKKYPTIATKMAKLLGIFAKLNKYACLDFYSNFPFNSHAEAETIISAFWVFPAYFLDTVGYLDEKIFYSPEDIDYCVRIRQAGHRVFYYPQIEAVHCTQQISHKKPFSRIAVSHFCGLVYYFMKHSYAFSPKKAGTGAMRKALQRP